MFLLEPAVAGAAQDLVFSASDLVAAADCEYRTLRILDEKLGRAAKAVFPPDPMQERAGRLGDKHEDTVLQSLLNRYGRWDPSRTGGVYLIDRGDTTRDALLGKHAETEQALRSGADVVFQATFFDGGFLGYADFLVNEHAGSGTAGRFQVWDTKLARHAKVGALLQLAAYGDQLLGMGLEPSPVVTLVLGTKVGDDWLRSHHSLPDLLPVFRDRRRRFRELTGMHRVSGAAVQWQQPGVVHCGRCDYCAEQVELSRDLLMVGGMSLVQRKKLLARGVGTIDALAGMPPAEATGALAKLRGQARMQLGLDPAHGSRTYSRNGQEHHVAFSVLEPNALDQIPPPSPGDIFFDFEGDPLWQDPATGKWGIEYLFGVVEAPRPEAGPDSESGPTSEVGSDSEAASDAKYLDPESESDFGSSASPVFKPFWAHSLSGERQAFLDFLAYVEDRRARYPDMHVYHYAAYEKSALRKLSLAHLAGEEIVDAWLREGLLVDLYAVVRQSIRISEPSYSIKKLEPLYMGAHLRSGDVTDAGASVVAYAAYCAARDSGDDEEAQRILTSIADYNHYDCLSTLRLRDWLLELKKSSTGQDAAAAVSVASAVSTADGVSTAGGAEGLTAFAPAPPAPAPSVAAAAPPSASARTDPEASAEEIRLRSFLAGLPDHRPWSHDERAIAMVAAATGYHRRERKQFWWEHFDRTGTELDRWSEHRNVFVVESAEVARDWELAKPTERMRTRTLRLLGSMTEGSDFKEGTTWCRLYDPPGPEGMSASESDALARSYSFGTAISAMEAAPDQAGKWHITIAERESKKVPAYQHLPMALTADQPLATASIEAALGELAQLVGSMVPSLPEHPGIDILRKVPPRFRTLPGPAAVPSGSVGATPDYAAAIVASLQDLHRSYLAVQGPPGTGKTFVGARVIGQLVAQGWKIGVVGQSHNVVENLLCRAIDAGGVPPDRVAKKLSVAHPVPWHRTADDDVAALLDSPGGCLVGGTAWTMTGRQVPAGALDLLVIDEAGQFSLANTLAVSRAANRLLLLGDPQQLPQVTQGSHPEPVDESALGWLAAGHATLPPELGYFLADTWRMHPELCRAVSVLSYEGKLRSAPAAAQRSLEELPPGVETVFVQHTGSTTHSEDEAAEVVAQVFRHIGLKWNAGGSEPPRPLAAGDILVVAAYNAQVQLIRRMLDQDGLTEVRVGTVDKFQGQEAPVVLVSMACSAIAEAPRGAAFLLNRNRINVAVSRGQWRAVIIRSPELTNYMPHRPEALEELGAFLGLSPGPSA